jgi:hypothetical protein
VWVGDGVPLELQENKIKEAKRQLVVERRRTRL